MSEWIAGQVSVYDPETATWRSWRLPGERPQAYAVYVDEQEHVWLSDFGANAVVLFEPEKEHFEVFPSDRPHANVRQILRPAGRSLGARIGNRSPRGLSYGVVTGFGGRGRRGRPQPRLHYPPCCGAPFSG